MKYLNYRVNNIRKRMRAKEIYKSNKTISSQDYDSWSELSNNNPISENSDEFFDIKIYDDFSMNQINPKYYLDQVQHYKAKYQEVLFENEKLKQEILNLRNHEAEQRNNLKSINEYFKMICNQTNYLSTKIKDMETLQNYSNELISEKSKYEALDKSVCVFVNDLNESLNCPIKFDRVDDPVITPWGVTYDRLWIEQHLKKNKIDPVTKQRLILKNLIPNYTVKNLLEKVKKFEKRLDDDSKIIT